MTNDSSDMTLLYYTANKLPDRFANGIREELVKASNGKPIISISQKPIDFGTNVLADDLAPSVHSVYVQIYRGAKAANTKYVACCEDDTVYVPEHFDVQPPEDTFYYNLNSWHLRRNVFYCRGHMIMSQCVAPRDLMIKTLEIRFEKFPTPESIRRFFGEPGRGEKFLGLPRVKALGFRTENPTVTFRHRNSLSGVRSIPSRIPVEENLPYWGNAMELWLRIHG